MSVAQFQACLKLGPTGRKMEDKKCNCEEKKKENTTLSMLYNLGLGGGVVMHSFKPALCASLQSLEILGHVLDVEYL